MSRRTYIFDANAGRTIAVDESGEVPLGLDRLSGLLDHLANRGAHGLLRAFTLACVERMPDYGSEHTRLFVDATLRDDTATLRHLRMQYTHVSMAASGVGLRNGARNAAAYLAAFAATDPDVHAGAAVAAQMERVHAELSIGRPEPSRVPLPDEVTQTQIDWLLDRLRAV